MTTLRGFWIGCALVLVFSVSSGRAQQPSPPCASEPAFSQLDFWLGHWEVYVGDQKVGQNHIEKILDGCAVTEDWTDARGGKGHSLFYYLPGRKTWRQVWVTARALAGGGVKEKELVSRLGDGSLVFQGEIPSQQGGSYLDRTTLTPVGPGEVRQLIEASRDGGLSWQTLFEGRYERLP